MAEGGEGDETKQNPFSFKNFLPSKDTTETRQKKEDDFDSFDLPDDSNQKKREKPRQQLLVEDDLKPTQKKKTKSQNPFSFKQFIASTSTSSSNASNVKPVNTASISSGQETENVGSTTNKTASFPEPVPLLPDVAPDVTGDLPDFVQDHFCEGVPNSSPRGLELPDFTFTNQSPTVPNVQEGDRSRHLRTLNVLDSDGDDDNDLLSSGSGQDIPSEADPDGNFILRTVGTSQKLPDFLSDGAIGSDNSMDVSQSDSYNTDGNKVAMVYVNGDIELEIHRVREENKHLRQQLRDVQTSHRQQLRDMQTSHRQQQDSVVDVERKIVVLKKKEAEETAAMEKAILEVEQNLTTTTKRAVSAETIVTKLKQEVRSLQGEVRTLQNENQILRSGDKGMSDVKERTHYVSEQLSTAAFTAETSLRQLLSGVENLKLLSKVLTSIDKISEEPSSTHSPTQHQGNSKDNT